MSLRSNRAPPATIGPAAAERPRGAEPAERTATPPVGAAVSSGSPPLSYLENGLVVFTAAYHLARGSCCGSGCRHCPFDPPHAAGSRKVR
jgi:hypothetical protein